MFSPYLPICFESYCSRGSVIQVSSFLSTSCTVAVVSRENVPALCAGGGSSRKKVITEFKEETRKKFQDEWSGVVRGESEKRRGSARGLSQSLPSP